MFFVFYTWTDYFETVVGVVLEVVVVVVSKDQKDIIPSLLPIPLFFLFFKLFHNIESLQYVESVFTMVNYVKKREN